MRHLIKQGHRRIGIITGPLELQTGAERLQGYELALKDSGIERDPKLIVEGDFRYESGRRLAIELLQSRLPPSAIFVCNGVMGQGVLQALGELKRTTPGDVALATFDDVSPDHGFYPQVTAVVQPSYEMGSQAATMLMDRVEVIWKVAAV